MDSSETWQPAYSPWRHGGWYVDNVRYPSGAVGCVSRNYPDGKWRIACDSRPGAYELHTYPNRDAAARAEYELAQQQHAERIASLAGDLYHNPEGPNGRRANCAACGTGVPEGSGVEVWRTGMTAIAFLHQQCAEKVAEYRRRRQLAQRQGGEVRRQG